MNYHDQNRESNLTFKRSRANFEDLDAKGLVKELLTDDQINAITVCFSDIEGRLHMLDYDKNFLLKSDDNLTFDGSSIRGFTAQHESDLKLEVDWAACYILPREYFGDKLFVFGEVKDRDGKTYTSDIRSTLRKYLAELKKYHNYKVNVAAEIEGFLFGGENLEKVYNVNRSFPYVTTGGYFNTLPGSPLRRYIDEVARVQRIAGFENEKDHPEVAPSQFEINWSHTEALVAADQIQLYKMICRQIAASQQKTACFLPKPLVGVNGNGMHINISLSRDTNLFFGNEKHNISKLSWTFINGVLVHGEDLCLALNSSVNSYRRLDPAFEAPNEIKASAIDRGSMIRIPVGNKKSARIEVRTVAPDANPYLAILSILKAGLSSTSTLSMSGATLPSNIYRAIECFKNSSLMIKALGKETHSKYINWKEEAADRCPRKLGSVIKAGEIMFHHEVTNQQLWNMF